MKIIKNTYHNKIFLRHLFLMSLLAGILGSLDFLLFEHSLSRSDYITRKLPLFALFIIICNFSLYLILKAQATPINKLMKAAREIGKKGRTSLIRIDTNDEFELLANSFNQMSHSITTQIQDLEKAQARLEEANQVKARFLANLSHELRTPLNAIKVSSEFLMEDEDISAESTEFVHMIYDGSKLLNEHLDHIFNLQGSLDTSKDNVEGNFYIPHLIEEVLEPIQALADHKKLDIDLSLPDPLQGVEYYSYHHRLQVLLHILLDNAIKFTEFGFIRIEVSAMMLDRQKDIVRFSVIDSGQGVPSEDIATIFDPFHQLDDSDTKAHDGLGLGLALAQNHAKFFGTRIELQSELGKGSEFSFEVIMERVNPRLGEHPT